MSVDPRVEDYLRKRLDMTNENDVALWNMTQEIGQIPYEHVFEEFVEEMMNDLAKFDAQIDAAETRRLSNLNDRAIRNECQEQLIGLRKDRDELRQVLGRKTYQRVVTELRGRAIRTR